MFWIGLFISMPKFSYMLENYPYLSYLENKGNNDYFRNFWNMQKIKSKIKL